MALTRRARRHQANARANDPTHPDNQQRHVESVYTLEDVCSSVQGVVRHVVPRAVNPWRVARDAKRPSNAKKY